MSVIPDATISSTTYWITGLSTIGSISLGIAFVWGRNLVPNPAAGITALRTFGNVFFIKSYTGIISINNHLSNRSKFDKLRAYMAELPTFTRPDFRGGPVVFLKEVK